MGKKYIAFLRLYDGGFALIKQNPKSISILQDGSRFLGLFWKGKPENYTPHILILGVILGRERSVL